MLDLSNYEKSLNSLKRSLDYQSKYLNLDVDARENLEMALIQKFEILYEQTWKMMKKWLELNFPEYKMNYLTIKEVFKLAGKHNLTDNVDAWFEFQRLRNLTSHTYNEKNVELILGKIQLFYGLSLLTFQRIAEKND